MRLPCAFFRTVASWGVLSAFAVGALAQQDAGRDFGVDKMPMLTRDMASGHLIHLATSSDGLTWTEQPTPILVRSSSAELIELTTDSPVGPKGALCAYFMDASKTRGPSNGQIGRSISTDGGKTWSEPETLTFDGFGRKAAPNNPAIVLLEDGRVRIYCDLYAAPKSQQDDPTRFLIVSFTSRDGVRFVRDDGFRYEAPRIGDPELVQVGGEWIMLIGRQKDTLVARSSDGLNFTRDERIGPIEGATPGALVLDDESLRVFTSRDGGGAIISGVLNLKTGEYKADDGSRFAAPAADPSVIRRSDGSYLMSLRRWKARVP